MALLRGDRIVIKPPGGKARSGRYSLYPDEDYRRDKAARSDEKLAAELSAYIQIAMQALYANSTGLSDNPGTESSAANTP